MNVDELIAPGRLGPALAEATGQDAWRQVSAELISGGKSNLTFTLTNPAGEELILRRPPTGELLPSAHDMGREARVQEGLAATDIPVPRIVLHDEGDLIGIQCYVMEKVEGHIIRGELPAGWAETTEQRQAMAHVFVDTLADLHAVYPQAIGLDDYGRPAGFMERQIRRWGGQWEASKTHAVPELEELGRLLAARIPEQQRSSIVHGDYRTDNVIHSLDDPGRIGAVLDWELSTLGDPLADVGQLMLYWREPGEPQFHLIPGVTHLPGFPDRAALLDRYAARSGADLSEMAFYQGYAHYKFAIIAQGVSARSRAGAMGGQDFGDLDDEILYLARTGLEHVKEH